MQIPTIRAARDSDAPELARLHVACWKETYVGLVPRSEIAARDFEVRFLQWQDQLVAGLSRIVICPGFGFAQMGPRRDLSLQKSGWPEELYCLFLRISAQRRGLGLALMQAVTGYAPFTALVLARNNTACRLYEAAGGAQIDRRSDWLGTVRVDEVVFGFRPARDGMDDITIRELTKSGEPGRSGS